MAKYGLRKTIQFDKDTWEKVRKIAYDKNTTPSEVVRKAVSYLIAWPPNKESVFIPEDARRTTNVLL